MWSVSPNDYLSTAIISTFDYENYNEAPDDIGEKVPWNCKYAAYIAKETARRTNVSIRNLKSPKSQTKFMLRISPVIHPTQVAACPSLESIELKLSEEYFSINICNDNGLSTRLK